MEGLTIREVLAVYVVAHLETTDDENGIKDSRWNKWIFKIGEIIMGGRNKLDKTVAKTVKLMSEDNRFQMTLSEEELSELNKKIKELENE